MSILCSPSPPLIASSKILRLLLVTPLSKLTTLLTVTVPEFSPTLFTLCPFYSSSRVISFTDRTKSCSLTPFLCIKSNEETTAVLITTIPSVNLRITSSPTASPSLRLNYGPSRFDDGSLLQKSSINCLAIIGLQI